MTHSSLAPTALRRGFLLAILFCTLPLCLFAQRSVTIKVTNSLKDDVPIAVYWRNPTDREEKRVTHLIPKGETDEIEGYSGHVFVAYDQSVQYFKEFITPEPKAGESVVDFTVSALIKKSAVARFVNRSGSGPMEIFWKNTQTGEEVKASPEIASGDWYDVESHTGHVFVAKNMEGTKLKEFVVKAVPGVREEHTVGDKAKATFYNKMRKTMRIFYIDEATGKEVGVGQDIEPGSYQGVFADPGHKFIVYDDKKRRSKEYTVSAAFGEQQTFHVEL